MKSEAKKRNMPDPMAFTKMPINKNEVHVMLKGGAYSIVNNVPTSKITNNGSMANLEADQPTKFTLTKGDDADMLRVSHINE